MTAVFSQTISHSADSSIKRTVTFASTVALILTIFSSCNSNPDNKVNRKLFSRTTYLSTWADTNSIKSNETFYDDSGRIIQEISYLPDNKILNKSQNEYLDGNIKRETITDYDFNSTTTILTYYDELKRESKNIYSITAGDTMPYDSVINYYDERNKIMRQKKYKDGLLVPSDTTVTIYNDSGKEIEKIQYGERPRHYYYSYSDDKLVQLKIHDENFNDDKITVYNYKNDTLFEEKSYWVKQPQKKFISKHTYQYK